LVVLAAPLLPSSPPALLRAALQKGFVMSRFAVAMLAASLSICSASAFAADPAQPVKAVTAAVRQMPAGTAQREAAVRQVLHDDFDLAFTARQALGAHWEAATPEQRARFVAAVEASEAHAYGERLGMLSGASLVVDRIVPRGAGAWTVESTVDSLADLPTLKLSWEVRDSGQGPRIVDVKVAGVSLFMTRRSEFNAVIARSGGQIEPLVAQLEARASR
jgi:phospholipid transport system substrate-binding protein